MRKCIFCESKTIAFYVSSNETYICPKHYYTAKQEFGEKAVEHFSKNKIVVDGKIAYMSIYNYELREKEIVLIDSEDIDIVKHIRWYLNNNYIPMTSIAPNKMRISKITNRVIKNQVNLSDYIMYKRFGIKRPIYYTNNNTLDCRKSNLRMCRDRREMSSIKHIIGK